MIPIIKAKTVNDGFVFFKTDTILCVLSDINNKSMCVVYTELFLEGISVCASANDFSNSWMNALYYDVEDLQDSVNGLH